MTTDQLTPPPSTPSDAELVARVRAALDEVAATSSAGSAVGGGGRGGSRPRMWGRIAAAAAVIAVGVVAVAVLRPDRRDPLRPAADTTGTGASDPGPSSSDGPLPYFLATGEEFPPGEITVADPCCAGTGTMVTAWARGGDPAAGLLVAWTAPLYSDYLPDLPGEVTAVTTADSSISTVSLGLSTSEREDLTAQITPGSGLPWILPAEGWEWLGFSMAADQPALVQSFGTVSLSSRVSLEAFIELTTATAVEAVTVAGEPGWSFSLPDGSTEVVWRDPRSGLWSSLSVPADLAARVDELTAAVEMNTVGEESADTSVPAPDTQLGTVTAVRGEALPPFDSAADIDPAVGMVAPLPSTTEGDLVIDGPTLFVFVAPWSRGSADEVQVLLDGIRGGALDGIRVVLVVTADSTSAPLSADWSVAGEWGAAFYDLPTADGAAGELAQAHGASTWPYFVAVDSNGLVTDRASGSMPIEGVAAVAMSAAVQAEPLGRLVIDAIGLDWVVGGSPALDTKEGPAWGWADGVMFIVGNRTTYGAPFFRLDELQPGDVITLETADGTSTFEVTLVESCPAQPNNLDLEACTSRPGDDLLLVTFDPPYTSMARLTVHADEIPAG